MTKNDYAKKLGDLKVLEHYRPDDIYIESCIRMLRKGEFQTEEGKPISTQLFRTLDKSLDYISEDTLKTLTETDVYIMPISACLSFCSIHEGRKEVFLTAGMIDLITNHTLSYFIESGLPEGLEDYKVPGLEEVDARDTVAEMLFIMNYRFYRFGEELPPLRSMVSQQVLDEYDAVINGGILFLILHELGHLELGHLDGQHNGPNRYHAIIDERLCYEQKQEIEADRYALDCIKPKYRAIGKTWLMVALGFFEQLEEITGIRSKYHPVSINRTYLGHKHLEGAKFNQEEFFSRDELDFSKFASNFNNVEKNNFHHDEHFLETSKNDAMKTLIYIDLEILQKHFQMSVQQAWMGPF